MVKSSVRIGPWILNQNIRSERIDGLVEELKNTLLGNRVVFAEIDSAKGPDALPEQGWLGPITTPIALERLADGRSRIFIHVGLGVHVPLQPLTFNGREYPSMVDIRGDHVSIVVPYYFLATRSRVDYRRYIITAIGRS
jgi:hypothetical protein